MTTQLMSHLGDCTIYRSIVNQSPEDGICTCGYGWSLVRRDADWSQMYSAERTAEMERVAVEKEQELYLLQNCNGGYVGNSPLFWREGGSGYTPWIDEAKRWTRDEAEREIRATRGTHSWKLWSVGEIEAAAKRTVDIQDLRAAELARKGGEAIAKSFDIATLTALGFQQFDNDGKFFKKPGRRGLFSFDSNRHLIWEHPPGDVIATFETPEQLRDFFADTRQARK